MQKVPYHNKTDKPVHIGPVTIMPNQTRVVDSQYLLIKAREEARKADEYVALLEAMSDEELKEELLSVGDDAGKLALVQDQLSKRKEV